LYRGGQMALNVLSKKVEFLYSSLNIRVLQAIEAEFADIQKLGPDSTSKSSLSSSFLFLEALYPLVKHVKWVHTPVFQGLLTEFLQMDHGIPRKLATTMIQGLIESLARSGFVKKGGSLTDDREYLKMAYVLAATADSDDDLELDLGLGSAIVRKLKDGISVLDQGITDIYIPEYDAILASIVIEVNHSIRTHSWALDLERLKFKLMEELGDRAIECLIEENLLDLMRLLASLGHRKGNKVHSIDANIQVLESAKLIEPNLSSAGKKTSWNLTRLGAAISFKHFWADFSQSKAMNEALFLSLNETWQKRLVTSNDCLSTTFVEIILMKHAATLSPETIEASLMRLISDVDTSVDPAMILQLIESVTFPWQKASVLRVISRMNPSDELVELVANSLAKSPSQSIVNAANEILELWAPKTSHMISQESVR
ncbi:MAG: hypothetical protein NT027_00875, partial [Proteobacteria bacterium]|nr:hypothetical protein [Pseudomonadota bacterium]